MGRPTKAEQAQKQFEAKGTFESELEATHAKAEEARQEAIADDKDNGLIHGVPKDEYEKMDYPQQMRAKMQDPNSSLRNQETLEDVIDYQLLNSTNAHTIVSMTGKTLDELQVRADKLGVKLKGTAAGDFQAGV